MYAVSVIFTIKSDHIAEFRKLIQEHAVRTLRREEACRQFDVGFDAERPELVFLYEVYDDRAGFDVHASADYLGEFFETACDWIASKESHRWDVMPR